ncbi:thioredoxin, mitochondrial [Hyperolius riggenbachi]|uniref:thioredoxin, mitochondrial n=1 Tax=Hyperolius riggenbachi TaxID=752182 RepID=UPI0035A36B1C
MAQRLVLKRLLTFSGRCLIRPAQTFSALLPKSSQNYGIHASALSFSPFNGYNAACEISTSPLSRVTFNIQNKDDFQERVVGCDTPVVVDFHAQWCGPCKILAPRLEKAVAKHQGKVLMAKVDIDDHTDLALEYEVSAVPTVLAMKNGNVVDHFVGVKDEDHLEAFIKKLVGPCP